MEILFENNNVIAINKPAGMLVHDDGSNTEKTVAFWVHDTYPEIVGVGESITLRTGEVIEKPGIVHRLDRETSGVLLIAKTQESFLNLKEQFQNHEIEKTYHAFVYGNIEEDDGTIDRPIGKSKSDFRKWSAQRGARGVLREAQTDFKVLEQTPSGEVTFLELYPKTGRTHQIRVHLKAIHHPVVSDFLYAPKGEKLLGLDRVALHARKIAYKDVNGERFEIEAPYPPDFKEAIAHFRAL